MDLFATWVIRLRLWVILATALLTVAGAVSIAKWAHIEADFSKYLPEDDPVVIRFSEAGERFGGVAVAMVGVEFDDVFTPEALELIHELTTEIGKVPGVTWVISLTEMDDVQANIVEGESTVSVRPVVDPDDMPDTPEELASLKEYVLGKEELVGVVVSADARLASLTFNIAKEADRVDVAVAVEDRVRRLAEQKKLYFAGFPYWMKGMSEIILKDMMILVPVVTLVVILILFLSFLSVRGVVLPMLTVMISSTWAMGLMAALGIPITMLSNVIPVLLIALGTAYAIHLLHKVDEIEVGEAGEGENYERHLRKAMVDVMVPIGLAGLTTVIGFLSFLTSNLVFIRHFGLMAAFGIFSAMLVAMTLLPALLSFLEPTKARAGRERNGPGWLGRMLDRTGASVLRRRRSVLVVAVALAGLAAAFIPQINRQFNMVAYFPEQSAVRQADTMMRDKLGGNVPIWVNVDGNPKDPFVAQQMHTVEKFLCTFSDVSNIRSVAGLVAEMNHVMTGHRAVPGTAEGVGNLWFNLEGKDVLAQFVDKTRKHALIHAVSKSSGTARLRVIVAEMEEFLHELPQRARRVDLGAAEADLADRARRARLAQVAWNVSLDLIHRLGEGVPSREEILEWLRQGMAAPVRMADAVVYTARAKELLVSDESDIEIEDEQVAASLAEALGAIAAAGKSNRESIEAMIRNHLPEDLITEDPEGVGYLAKSLDVLVRDLDHRRRIEGVLQQLLDELPAGTRKNERLVEELDGDLWPLVYQVAWLPLARDEKAPDGEVSQAVFGQTGMHHISVNIDSRLVYSQLSSLGLAALMAMLLMMIQFRSLLAGLLGMIPMVLTLLINFGVMGAFGIDLDSSTVLIASLVVGVGIDYTIHFLSRTRLEMIRSGDPAGALEMVQRTVGRAILINAVTVTAGQLVFLAGELIPLHYFGALLAVAMVTSALAAVTVMPAVLFMTSPKFLMRKNF